MFELDLFVNASRFTGILQPCELSCDGVPYSKGFDVISSKKPLKNLKILYFNSTSFQSLQLGVGTKKFDTSVVRNFISMVMDEYTPSLILGDIMSDSKQQLILIGETGTNSQAPFNIMGGCIYKIDPHYGVFVSILHITKNFRRRGLGKFMLRLLQTFSSKVFSSERILVWMTRLEIEHKQNNGVFTLSYKNIGHISFYRKLGFFPSNPLHLPLEQMVPTSLCKLLRSPISGFNTMSVGPESIEFIGECIESISKIKARNKHTTEECCSCFIKEKEVLITCSECQLKMCIRCYSQFSIKIPKDKCLFHIAGEFLSEGSVRRMLKTFHKTIQENIGNNNIYLRQKGNQFNSQLPCKICQWEKSCPSFIKMSKLPLVRNPPSPSFTMSSKTKKLPAFDLKHFNHQNDLRLANDLLSKRRHLLDDNICSFSSHQTTKPKHSKLFLMNMNCNSSILQNANLELCSSLAFGDCGFLSILWCIRSNLPLGDEVKQIIQNKLKEYKVDIPRKAQLDVNMLRSIFLHERLSRKHEDKFLEYTKYSFISDLADSPIMIEEAVEFDEGICNAYYDYAREDSGEEDTKMLLELLQRSTETNVDLRQIYFLSSVDILFLPIITNNKVGALGVQQHSDTTVSTQTDILIDFGYHACTDRFLLKDCEYIILLRHISGGGGHFDFFMSARTKEAVFSRDSIEISHLLTLCDADMRHALTGVSKREKNKKKNQEKDTDYRFPVDVIEWFDMFYKYLGNNPPIFPPKYNYTQLKGFMREKHLDFIPIYVQPISTKNKMQPIPLEKNYQIEHLYVVYYEKKHNKLILLDCNMMDIPFIFQRSIFKKLEITRLKELLNSHHWLMFHRSKVREIEDHFLLEWEKRHDGGMFYRPIYQVLNCEDIFDGKRVSIACWKYWKLVPTNKEKKKYFKHFLIFRNPYLKRYFDCYKQYGESQYECYDGEKMDELNLLIRKIYPNHHIIINKDSNSHYEGGLRVLMMMDVELLVHYVIPKNLKSHSLTVIKGAFKVFDKSILSTLQKENDGMNLGKIGMSDYMHMIESMIWYPDKSQVQLKLFDWLKILGTVYSEDSVKLYAGSKKNTMFDEDFLHLWFTFATCIQKYMGSFLSDALHSNIKEKKHEAVETNKLIQNDKAWIDEAIKGGFTSYWKTEQHTQYTLCYFEAKNAVNKTDTWNVKSKGDFTDYMSFNIKFEFTEFMNLVIRKFIYYLSITDQEEKKRRKKRTLHWFIKLILLVVTFSIIYSMGIGSMIILWIFLVIYFKDPQKHTSFSAVIH